MQAITHKNRICDLMQHLIHVDFRLLECGNDCDLVQMMIPIFDHYKPMSSFIDHIGIFAYEMLEAYRETNPPTDEPMVKWLQQVLIQLVEFDLDQNA